MINAELKQNLTKIKKFLKSSDLNNIDSGIEIIRSLNKPELFEALLGGVHIGKESNMIFIDKNYTGSTLTKRWSSETVDFYRYALFQLIIYAPQNIDIDTSIKQKNITSLNLRSNNLSSLPAEIGQLGRLTSLNLNFNNLTSIPAEIGRLNKLTSLDLRFNNLTSLPAEIGQLNRLTSLNLSYNNLTSLPAEIGQLNRLTSLDLSYNNLTSLPAEISLLEKLESLSMTNCIKSFPSEITHIKNLLSLELNYNELTSLPPEIGQLKKLTSLDLYNNKLSKLPPEIFSLTKTKIDLGDSFYCEDGETDKWIKSLRPEHFSILLKNYSYKDGNFNEDSDEDETGFCRIPDDILIKLLASCPAESKINRSLKPDNITSLNVSSICVIPREIVQFVNLHTLKVEGWRRGNSLESLPSEIGQLKNLNSIDLSRSSDLAVLPFEISQLRNLNYLNLEGCNRIKPKPSPEIMDTRQRVKKFQFKILIAAGKEIPDYLKEKKKTSINRKTLVNIKKFLKNRDYNNINSGIELVRSLDEPSIFEELLENCSIDKANRLAKNNFFTGTGPAQPYLDYALLGLVACATETANIDKSLKRSNIKSLNLSGFVEGLGSTGAWEWTELPSGIVNFKNLTSLDLNYCHRLQNVDELANLTNLTNLDLRNCGDLQNVDFLTNLTNITKLSLSEVKINVDVLINLTNLTNLDLSSCNLQNVDSLANLTNLTNLDLSKCYELQNIDELANLTKLTSLNLSSCHSIIQPQKEVMTTRKEVIEYQDKIRFVMALIDGNTKVLSDYKDNTSLDLSRCNLQNVDVLANLTNLTNLNLSGCESLQNVDGLANLNKLISLDLYSCKSLQNVVVLANLIKLTSLVLSSCESLQNVDSLANCSNLTRLDLKCCNFHNVDSLANLTNLNSLDLSGCESLQNVDGLANLTKLNSLNLSFCKSLQNVDGLANLTNLTSLDLSSCESLQNVDGMSNLPNLTSLDLHYCKSLQDVDGLSNLTKLISLDLHYCKSLQNVDGLSNLTNLTDLDMRDWEIVNPAPRKYWMDERDQVVEYQVKIKKSMK